MRIWIPLALTGAMIVHHAVLWALTAARRGFSLLEVMNRWDSAHYTAIVEQGYSGVLYAFLPLYPALVAAARRFLGDAVAVPWIGAALSTAFLLSFVAWCATREEPAPPEHSPLTPRTGWGWFALLYSPASYALHSHHTEAVFLLLSFGALASAWDGRAWRAAVFCALCVWTRNQGVFVAGAAALLLIERAPSGARRIARSVPIIVLAASAYAALMVWEYHQAGDPFAHLRAQRHWVPVTTVGEAFRGLWWGRHGPGATHVLHNLFAAALVLASVLVWRRSRALALYGLISIAVMLPQGDLGNSFRFGAVLFPALFAAGDWIAYRPWWVRVAVASAVAWLNHRVTHAFAIGNWAY